MPFKDQLDSFRIKAGERYKGYQDVLVEYHQEESKRLLGLVRATGAKAFVVHDKEEGYSRVFVRETDMPKTNIIVYDPFFQAKRHTA